MKWRLFSLKMATEEEDILVSSSMNGTWNYRKGIGDVNIFSDLIAGHDNYNVIKHKGREINLFDILTLSLKCIKKNPSVSLQNTLTSSTMKALLYSVTPTILLQEQNLEV